MPDLGHGAPAPTPSRRALRRQETVRRILDAAWALSRERGLTGWTLRDLGAEVGMRAPSLYGYADSKNALFDLMFADGYRQLAERIEAAERPEDPRALLRTAARLYVRFAAEEPARFQLLFQFTAPGFEPSPESMALAGQTLGELAEVLAIAGVDDPAEVDLCTAVLTGLASQQVANDPGGDRWLRLVEVAVDRLLAPATGGNEDQPPRARGTSGHLSRGKVLPAQPSNLLVSPAAVEHVGEGESDGAI